MLLSGLMVILMRFMNSSTDNVEKIQKIKMTLLQHRNFHITKQCKNISFQAGLSEQQCCSVKAAFEMIDFVAF